MNEEIGVFGEGFSVGLLKGNKKGNKRREAILKVKRDIEEPFTAFVAKVIVMTFDAIDVTTRYMNTCPIFDILFLLSLITSSISVSLFIVKDAA